MSHKISISRANRLYDKEMKLREIQKQNKPLPTSRRQKKYIAMRLRQDGKLWKIKDRIFKTGGRLPEHLEDKDENKKRDI